MSMVDSLSSENVPPTNAPIFILATGHRCGSTLIQRLLNSHRDILIWGEQRGHLNQFLPEYRALLRFCDQQKPLRNVYLTKGYDHFLANLMPSDEQVRDAAVAYLKGLFEIP